MVELDKIAAHALKCNQIYNICFDWGKNAIIPPVTDIIGYYMRTTPPYDGNYSICGHTCIGSESFGM